MAAERKDIRAKLDADTHAKLKAICDLDGVDMGDFIEGALVPIIEKRVHDAMVLADKLHRLGIVGSGLRGSGRSGNGDGSHSGGAVA